MKEGRDSQVLVGRPGTKTVDILDGEGSGQTGKRLGSPEVGESKLHYLYNCSGDTSGCGPLAEIRRYDWSTKSYSSLKLPSHGGNSLDGAVAIARGKSKIFYVLPATEPLNGDITGYELYSLSSSGLDFVESKYPL